MSLVEKLREWRSGFGRQGMGGAAALMEQAADEIVKLREIMSRCYVCQLEIDEDEVLR